MKVASVKKQQHRDVQVNNVGQASLWSTAQVDSKCGLVVIR